MQTKMKIFSDGGARGNPGPAAIAFLITTEQNHVLKKASRYIGKHTNNQAEYLALLYALETATTLTSDEIICHTDSELMTKQLRGEFGVRDFALRQLWQRVRELEKRFQKIRYVNVPRTDGHIQEADKLVNIVLDKEQGK